MRTLSRPLGGLVAILVVSAVAGCFKTPDLANLRCTTSEHCPDGYSCAVSQPGQPGACAKTLPAMDSGGADDMSTADAAVVVDSPVSPDVAVAIDIAAAAEVAATDLAAKGDGMSAVDGASDSPSDTPIAGPDAPPVAGPEAGADALSGRPRGAMCSLPSECADGFCADGRCCDRACTGTCEACDLATSVGTCAPLGKGASPRAGHGACTAADVVCGGSCDGISGSCSYPTTPCADASCVGKTYQPPGLCSAGSCVIPAAQACPANQSCSGNACACVSPSLACAGGCVDPRNDPKNCGKCGHDCAGGTCLQGQCQPIVVAGGLTLGAYVFGVDSEYLYFGSATPLGSPTPSPNTYRVSKTAVGGSSTLLTTTGGAIGVIGNTLFFARNRQGQQATCDLTSCSTLTWLPFLPSSGSSGELAAFRSPSPTHFALADHVNGPLDINWYSPSSVTTVVASYVEESVESPVDGGYAAHDRFVYWLRTSRDSGGTTTDVSLYGVDSSTLGRSRLAGGMTSDRLAILDANSRSVLILDWTNGNLYRAVLPFGTGASPAPLLLGGAQPSYATEDATRVYWVDSGGTIYNCIPDDCSGSKTIMTNGQDTVDFHQDDGFLYWGTSNPNQVVRLAK